MSILPCSHCGSRETYVCAQARGPATHHFDLEGQFVETGYDKLYFDPSQMVRCEACGKIRRDLYMTACGKIRHDLYMTSGRVVIGR